MKPGRVAWAILLLAMTGAANAAPPEKAIIEHYSTEKAKLLASTHKTYLRQVYDNVYRCYEWMDIRRLSFVSPNDVTADDRYLTVWVEVMQRITPAFAAAPVPQRASAMFKHYGVDLLRRLSSHPPLVQDPALTGFGVILTWIKPNGEPRPGIPGISETLAFFVDTTTLQRFLLRQASAAEFIQRATITGFDGRTEMGRLNLEVSDPGPTRAPLRDGQPAC